MTSDMFKKNFPAILLGLRYFLEWLIPVDVPAATSNSNIMKKKQETCFKPLEECMFAGSPDPVLKEIGTD